MFDSPDSAVANIIIFVSIVWLLAGIVLTLSDKD